MRKYGFLILLGMCGWMALPAGASTQCEQRFQFFFKTYGLNGTFWIGEDLTGECHFSRLLQLTPGEKTATLVTADLTKFGAWDWVEAAAEHLRIEKTEPWKEAEGSWRSADGKIQVTAPPPDAAQRKRFEEHIRQGGDNGCTWNQKYGPAGVVLPGFDGLSARLVYFYPAGLYVNYEIDRVYYFPKSRYLLIFTRQPQKAVGLDTMHGFLLFRLEPLPVAS